MCPACLGSLAWLMTGGVSGLGATAGVVALVRHRSIAAAISKIWKRAGQPLPSGFVSVAPGKASVQEPIKTGERHG